MCLVANVAAANTTRSSIGLWAQVGGSVGRASRRLVGFGGSSTDRVVWVVDQIMGPVRQLRTLDF